MKQKLFGTDGIRGVANRYPMTAEVALSLGRALVTTFQNGQKPRILIGKDTRLSGYMLETAMAAGICSQGGDVLLVGPMPTPGIAFLTQSMRADAGVVISASHNSFQDNGIKIFDASGFKLPDETESKIESFILSEQKERKNLEPETIGKALRIEDAPGRYIEFVKSTFPKHLTLDGLKIVVDCAHGATYMIAPVVFKELGAEVVLMGAEPNGRNINKGVGAVHPEAMAAQVKAVGAHCGIALDGDGDRVIFADEKGQVVEGDAILSLCAGEMIQDGVLKQKTLVATVMSNQGVIDYVTSRGGKVVRTSVGDRYVVEEMRGKGYNFGGEASGHLVFLDHVTTGDGLVAALQIFKIIQEKKQSLSQIVSGYRSYPQILTGIKVKEKRNLEEMNDLQKMIKTYEKELGASGRILVRYSGTEPLVRVMIEGKDEMKIQKMAKDLSQCVEKNLA